MEVGQTFLDSCMRTFLQLPDELGPVTSLDLGCGRGDHACAFRAAGYEHVVAIDRHLPPDLPTDHAIEWVEADVPTWIQDVGDTRAFTVVFCRHLIQHLPREVVWGTIIPGLKRLCAPGGYIALMTFEKRPKPDFQHSWKSLWTLEDVHLMFRGWEVVAAYSGTFEGPDMRNRTRRWYPTRILVRKPY